MDATPFRPRAMVDALLDFSKGVNNGIDYTLLPKNQLSNGHNTTVRGGFVGPRPPFRKLAVVASGDYGAEAELNAMAAGRYQGACYYHPDAGIDSLVASISGKLYRFEITGDTASVSHVMKTFTQDPTAGRCWLWQSEQYVVWNDGINNPVFYRPPSGGFAGGRSNYGTPVNHTARNTALFTIPPVGSTVLAVPFSNVTDLVVGDVITLQYRGSFTVQKIAGLLVDLLNVNATPEGSDMDVPPDDRFSWVTTGHQLPPGRMGCYGMGRNWVVLTDGKQFLASDLVGGSSGTVAQNFRDAVLNITENLYLFGGGTFAVPGSPGEIRAMCFSETLDSSLGQGALQVFTPYSVFSCNAPVDRTKWQEVTNPILTESAKGGGGLSQWSTINSNSDILSRSYDGIRSLVLTRREFNTWGNVPISREVENQLNRDSEDLLGYTSAVVFDNRNLMTTEGELVEGRGVIWKRLTVTNYDPFSSLAGKAPAVYDAFYWEGLNVLQLLKGSFQGMDRCFAFTLNKQNGLIELWEILKSASAQISDEFNRRIEWSFESPMIDFDQKDPKTRERLRLGQSEISIEDLRGKVSFMAYFKPEHWPCWIPWAMWDECATNESVIQSPGFRPNMGLPEPDASWCDSVNDRPLREGYYFQVRLVVQGHCKITSWKLHAVTVPQPRMAPPVCTAICPS